MLRLLAGGAAHTDVLVAIDGELIVGHAMAGDRAGPDGTRLTDIGVVVADGYRGLGLGSALVRGLAGQARLRGITAVVMEVLAENRQVLTMIADHWQVAREDRSGACITIWAPLPPEVRRAEPLPPEQEAEPWPPGSGTQPWLRGTGKDDLPCRRPGAHRPGRPAGRLSGIRRRSPAPGHQHGPSSFHAPDGPPGTSS